jgi:hypothetical protein
MTFFRERFEHGLAIQGSTQHEVVLDNQNPTSARKLVVTRSNKAFADT